MTYSCAVEDSHQLVWRYTVNGNTKSYSFVFDDPVSGEVFKLGPFELVLTGTEPITTTTGNIMSTATSANGLTTAENGAMISCAGITSPVIISFSG